MPPSDSQVVINGLLETKIPSYRHCRVCNTDNSPNAPDEYFYLYLKTSQAGGDTLDWVLDNHFRGPLLHPSCANRTTGPVRFRTEQLRNRHYTILCAPRILILYLDVVRIKFRTSEMAKRWNPTECPDMIDLARFAAPNLLRPGQTLSYKLSSIVAQTEVTHVVTLC